MARAVAGLWQIVICSVFMYMFFGTWLAPILLTLMLLPFLPLVLTREILIKDVWRRLDPVVPAVAALISIAVSGGIYWMLYVNQILMDD